MAAQCEHRPLATQLSDNIVARAYDFHSEVTQHFFDKKTDIVFVRARARDVHQVIKQVRALQEITSTAERTQSLREALRLRVFRLPYL